MQQSTMPRTASRGFTLIEVMVGLVLGMIAIIVMYQVFAVFEGQRRTTVAGGDAQTAGHLSLYGIERDMRLAGLGLIYIGRLDYDVYDGQVTCPGGIRTYSATAGGLGWADGSRPVAPVRITDGGANSDSFTVYYGPSAMGGAPATLAAPLNAGTMSLGILVSNAPWLNSASSPPINAVFKKDDYIMVAQPGANKHCIRLQISDVQLDPSSGNAILKVDAGSSYDPNPPSSAYPSFFPTGGYTTDPTAPAIVTHMGGALATNSYSVDANQQLLLNGQPIAEGVVAIQAQYGIGPVPGGGTPGCATSADAGCQRVTAWTDSVNSGGVNWAGLSTAADLPNIERIKAVRIAIVSRSALAERDPLYGAGLAIQPKASCLAAGDVVALAAGFGICAWRDEGAILAPRIDLTGQADWDRYRYRVYETIVPLRNVLWGTKDS